MTTAIYFPVWVGKSGRVSFRWGAACDRPKDAQRVGKAEVDAGRASVAFVVCCTGGEKVPLWSWTYPDSAKTIVGHWESLLDATEPE